MNSEDQIEASISKEENASNDQPVIWGSRPQRIPLKMMLPRETRDIAGFLERDDIRADLAATLKAPVESFATDVLLGGVRIDAILDLGGARDGEKVAVELQTGEADLDHLRKVCALQATEVSIHGVLWLAAGFSDDYRSRISLAQERNKLPLDAVALVAHRHHGSPAWVEWHRVTSDKPFEAIEASVTPISRRARAKQPKLEVVRATPRQEMISMYWPMIEDELRKQSFSIAHTRPGEAPRGHAVAGMGNRHARLEVTVRSTGIYIKLLLTDPTMAPDRPALAAYLCESLGRPVTISSRKSKNECPALEIDPISFGGSDVRESPIWVSQTVGNIAQKVKRSLQPYLKGELKNQNAS